MNNVARYIDWITGIYSDFVVAFLVSHKLPFLVIKY